VIESRTMTYYFVIPSFLTLVFVVSYLLVNLLLMAFDSLNFFWDWWDGLRRVFPALFVAEYAILGGFVYYIIKWELSGTP